MNNHKKYLLFALCLVCNQISLFAQDPFFIHFNNNKSYFNPALVGYKGALSVNTKYKSQWNARSAASYKTAMLGFEEHLLCSILDYGLMVIADEEGDGKFQTLDIGAKFAGTLPISTKKHFHNIRFGGGLQLMQQRIDYTRLVFSDQLDPKYGAILPTSFVNPNDRVTEVAFVPSVGVAYRAVFNKKNSSRKDIPFSLITGWSLHNINTGNRASILNLRTSPVPRSTIFLELEPIIFNNGDYFLGLQFLGLYQVQDEELFQGNYFSSNMAYWEYGVKFLFSRTAAFGVYNHLVKRSDIGENTNWLSFSLDIGDVFRFNQNSPRQRLDVGATVSSNISGLRNLIGPIFELSFSWHFSKGLFCGVGGAENDYIRDGNVVCPRSKSREKIYENIWYDPKW